METQHAQMQGITIEKFTWKIHNFSKLDSKRLYSKTFFLGGHPWRILIYSKENFLTPKCLSIFLDAGDLATLPENWSRFTKYKLALINQLLARKTIRKEGEHQFSARTPNWGFQEFIPLGEFYDSSKGFIINDTCIIEAEIEVDQGVCKTQVSAPAAYSEPTEHTDNSSPKDISTTSVVELLDFRGLGKIEKAFVPLLEEVCSWHPSLLDCQRKRKRSHRFTEWAFTALGRVLHFLKTKKLKDMNEDAVSHLQTLWEELQTCKFDLNWLEPHIQSALGMKSYTERFEQVKRIKKNVAELDKETTELKNKMVTAVVYLEMAKRELVKAEQDLEKRDLDAIIGYGGP